MNHVLLYGVNAAGQPTPLLVASDGSIAGSGGGGGLELGSTPTTQVFGDVASAGASVKAAPELHVHGMPNALYDAFAKIWDQKAQNTDGGSFTSGARRTRDLNQESDPDGIVSIAANQFVLAAGSYHIEAKVPAYNCNRHKAWLRNITDGADTLIGTSEVVGGVVMTSSEISGDFTIATQKTFEIQHRCETTSNTIGFGAATNFDVEIYTVVKIWRKV